MNIDNLENIKWLVDGCGEISIGRFASYECAAVASDEGGALAMLVRKKGESLGELLERLDSAINNATENGIFADEVNS